MTDVVIVSAARTAVGSFNGSLGALPAHQLGAAAIKEALKRADTDAKDVSEVIMGQILTAAQGQNPARQASIGAGVPVEVPEAAADIILGLADLLADVGGVELEVSDEGADVQAHRTPSVVVVGVRLP